MSIKIAYQGRPGAYSHLACKKAFPESIPVACETFEETLGRLRRGEYKIITKSTEDALSDYETNLRIIKKGIRTPEQIVESYRDEDFQHNKSRGL